MIKKVPIFDVKKESIAEEVGLKKGDLIITINGEEIIDILDYKFNEADSYIELEIEHEDGQVEIYEIEKDESDELGIIFETELIDKPKNCYNNCIFCFMEQLPKDVRETLIFKDDDYRLSFFSGNYITLTNMKEDDIKRIIKYRMSPINISVHATDEKVRCMMLNNRHAGKVLKYIDMLCDAGISINTQIVLCKGINDGKILEKTIKDLSKYIPSLKSICIVPVGLSKNRDGLYPLDRLEKEDCKSVIGCVEKYQREFKKKYGYVLVYLADEFYLKADQKFPDYEDYGSFDQIEDGIGMIANFDHEFNMELKRIEKNKNNFKTRKITIITGKITENYMMQKIKEINKIVPNINVNIVAPVNTYFGENITVTGLITGIDIKKTICKLRENQIDIGEYIVIPKVMLKEDEDIFLDDTKLENLQKDLGIKFVVTDGSAKTFIKSILLRRKLTSDITKLYENEMMVKNSYENSIK